MHINRYGADCELNNMEYFWHSISEKNDTRLNRLLFEKSIYLDDYDEDEFASVLIIGIDIRRRFSIGARIAVRSMGTTLQMDKSTLLEMLDNIDELLQENSVLPKCGHTKARIQSIHEAQYKISVGNKNVKVNAKALLTLRSKMSIIKMQIKLLECANYEKQFYDLLNYFCDGNLHKSELLNKMDMLIKEDFERLFVLEISTNFLDWFMTCIPLHCKALLHTHILIQ